MAALDKRHKYLLNKQVEFLLSDPVQARKPGVRTWDPYTAYRHEGWSRGGRCHCWRCTGRPPLPCHCSSASSCMNTATSRLLPTITLLLAYSTYSVLASHSNSDKDMVVVFSGASHSGSMPVPASVSQSHLSH